MRSCIVLNRLEVFYRWILQGRMKPLWYHGYSIKRYSRQYCSSSSVALAPLSYAAHENIPVDQTAQKRVDEGVLRNPSKYRGKKEWHFHSNRFDQVVSNDVVPRPDNEGMSLQKDSINGTPSHVDFVHLAWSWQKDRCHRNVENDVEYSKPVNHRCYSISFSWWMKRKQKRLKKKSETIQTNRLIISRWTVLINDSLDLFRTIDTKQFNSLCR